MTTGTGTSSEATEAQQPAQMATSAEVTGTPAPDEVTTLRSRNAGLDAKVTSLTAARVAAERLAAEAAQKLADYEAKTVGADEALRAQLQAKDAELASERRATKVARIEAKFPETFSLFGEAVANMAEDVLAASEARLKGVGTPETPETPTPVGSNAARTQSAVPKAIEDMSAAELRKHLATFPPSTWGGSSN